MALLDDLIGGVMSAVAGDKAPALNQFLQDNGGVNGLAQKFQSGGAGAVFISWPRRWVSIPSRPPTSPPRPCRS